METLPDILIPKPFIGGEWRDAKKHFAVTNPANGEILAQVPDLGAEETREAIAAAEAAWPSWKRRTAKERSNLLRAWFDAIMAHQEELARLMTMEQGKPIAESRGEVAYGASFVEFYSEEAKRLAGETLPSHGIDILVFRESIGVVAAVTPWNFPLAMITRKCAPALAAGCTVVIKPAESTPPDSLGAGTFSRACRAPCRGNQRNNRQPTGRRRRGADHRPAGAKIFLYRLYGGGQETPCSVCQYRQKGVNGARRQRAFYCV